MAGATAQVTLNLPVLRRGQDTGSTEVRRLQFLLNDTESASLHTDGNFGPKTEAAVEDFQRDHHLSADRVVGRQTWTALLNLWFFGEA